MFPKACAPYIEGAPALFLGISSGAAFAMIGATLITLLAQYRIKKSAVTMFALTFLAYDFKFLWAPPVDNGSSSLPEPSPGQRRSRLSPQLFAYIFACESSPVPGLRIWRSRASRKSGKSVPIETKFPSIINASELSPHYSKTEIDRFWTQHVAYSPSDDQLCNFMTVPRPQ